MQDRKLWQLMDTARRPYPETKFMALRDKSL